MPAAVSIITPVYNAAATLGRAVASVHAQDFADWEMILSEDGSGDDSAAVAAALAARDGRIRVLGDGTNGGAARARNRAIRAAEGRYIAFLDADDAWLPGKLSAQLALMRATGTVLSYTGFIRVAPDGREQVVRVPERLDYARALRGNAIGCLTAVYDAGALGRVEMPDLRLRQDYALWLKILRGGHVARGLTAPFARYHVAPGSLSSDRRRALAATWAVYRGAEGLSLPRAAACLSHHLWRRLRN